MNPEMHTDPYALAILAAAVWALFLADCWLRRPRKSQRPDAPKENTWRNRWH
jgi:hypothetical protein